MFVNFGKGKRTRIPVNRTIAPINWDFKLEEVKIGTEDATKINGLIRAMRKYAEDLLTEALTERYRDKKYVEIILQQKDLKEENIPIEYFKLRHDEIHTQSKNDVIEVFGKFYDHLAETITDGTLRNWSSFKKRLIEYKNEKKRLEFTDFTKDFENEFVKYFLDSDKDYGNGTINGHHGRLKKFVRWASENDFHNTIGYDKWDITLPKPDPEDNIFILNFEEIQRLKALKLKEKRLEEIRDCFVFNCCFGLRIEDFRNLQKKHIIKKNGRYWLQVKTKKTGSYSRGYLTKEAQEIYEKYKDLPGDKALPTPGKNIFNEGIKEICRLAKINQMVPYYIYRGAKADDVDEIMIEKWKKMSSHKARGSFISIGYNHYKLSLKTIMAITGHKDVKTLNHYLQIDEEELLDAVESMDAIDQEQRSKEAAERNGKEADS